MPIALTPTGAPSLFGGIGKLEFAPTNGPDDLFPTWVDITVYLRTESTALTITRGRQTELDTIQPSQLTAILDNTDGRFTFGLTTGPYGANWTPAKKVRYSETIGQRTFVLFTGWIEFPDIDSWQPIGYQEVSLTCTDRLTRLGRGRTFISTLGEHIIFNGGADLRAYWPCGEASLSFANFVPGGPPLIPTSPNVSTGGGVTYPLTGNAGVTLQSASVSADDLGLPAYTMAVDAADQTARSLNMLTRELTGAWRANTGEAITVVAWINPNLPTTVNLPLLLFFTSNGTVQVNPAGVPGSYITNCLTALTGSINNGVVRNAQWQPIAIRYNFTASSIELWLGTDRYTAALTGAPPATETVTDLYAPGGFAGGFGHVQLYIGTTWGRTQFLAQQQMGVTGLEYQTTGQRINTLLDYAGVPSTDRAVDPGVSYMQRARLAGQTPQAALQNAVTTERGRGFAAGDGRYVFHDRTRVMNV